MQGLILLCLIPILLAVTPYTWKNCGTDLPYIVKELFIEPYPVQQGKFVTITSNGTQSEDVNGGKWVADIYYRSFKVFEYTGNVCGLAPKCPCPCKPGNVVTQFRRLAPSFSPGGQYNGMFTSHDEKNNTLGCVEYTFQMGDD